MRIVVVVWSLSCVRLLANPWTAAGKVSPSFTVCLNFPKLLSVESVVPSNHLILCRPLLLLPFLSLSQHPGSQHRRLDRSSHSGGRKTGEHKVVETREGRLQKRVNCQSSQMPLRGQVTQQLKQSDWI